MTHRAWDRMRVAGIARALGLAGLVCACGGQAAGGTTNGVAVDNESSLEVRVIVNDQAVRELAPRSLVTIPRSELPDYPLAIVVTTVGGRPLVALAVQRGDVGVDHGAGNRVDLSCGRIDVWSGPPLNGPAPLPGSSGDCDP